MISSTASGPSRSSMPDAPDAQASADIRSAASASGARTQNRKKRVLIAVLCGVSLSISGCYLGHVAAGQARLMHARQPIDDILADPETPATLRRQLETVQRARTYAGTLGLDVNDQ